MSMYNQQGNGYQQQNMQQQGMSQQQANDYKYLFNLQQQGQQLNNEQYQMFNYLASLVPQQQNNQQQVNQQVPYQQQMPMQQQTQYVNQRPQRYQQNTSYQQQNGGYQQQVNMQNNQPQVTKTGGTSRYGSNGYEAAGYGTKEEVGVEPIIIEEPIVIDPNTLEPFDGHEYEFLTTPLQTCIATIKGDNKYYDIEDNENMVESEHAAVYIGNIKKYNRKIDVSDTKQINIVQELKVAESLSESINDLLIVAADNADESMYNVGEYIIITNHIVESITNTTQAYAFRDMVNNSKDLQELADAIVSKMNSNHKFIRSCYRDIDKELTKYFNLVILNTLGATITVDSFSEDIEAVILHIDKKLTSRKKSIYSAALIDIFSGVKDNVNALTDVVDTEVVQDSKVGNTFTGDKVTIAIHDNDSIKYELLDINNKAIKSIQSDLTPVLYSLVETIFMERSLANRMVILRDMDGKRYLIMKTKIGNNFTISKV